MTPDLFIRAGLDPALALLPVEMDSVRARAFVVAVCLQESQLQHRRQGGGGPARGYPQFEKAGILGVLTHHASKDSAADVCQALDIKPQVAPVYAAIEFNDVLASAFARLLVWTIPDPLPRRGQRDPSWHQYLAAWKPGKPRPDDWPENYTKAWDIVEPMHNDHGEHS